jgi:hypothetical protein
MAVQISFSPFIENESPHGERTRLVYEKDECLDPVAVATCPVGAPLYWAWARPVVGGNIPFDLPASFPPIAPRAATNAAELYAAATGFPLGAHQTNMGASSYAMFGVAQLDADVGDAANTQIELPAGIVVINNFTAMTSGWPDGFTAAQLAALRVIRTRGVVQARVDGTTDVAVGNYLEGVATAYNLILDAVNANVGTFIALEARTANSVAMIWVTCIGVSY